MLILLIVIAITLFVIQIRGVCSSSFLLQMLCLITFELIIMMVLKQFNIQYLNYIDALLIGIFTIPAFWQLSKFKSELLDNKNAEKEEELRIAHSIFQNTSEAMFVSDAESRIIAVNPAFVEITGYESSEIIGKTPNILRSGRQNESFYQEMWQSLQLQGKWEGEIWNRKKNGDEYAEWLTINTVYDKSGSVYRRVAIFIDISKKKKLEEVIWSQANYDQLTKLPNRRFFESQLDQIISVTKHNKSICAVLFVDLDGFKKINDNYGHSAGDKVLQETATRLQKCVRTSDIVSRLGGDEYTIILCQLISKSDAGRISQKILRELELPYILEDNQVTITASIGISFFPDDSKSRSDLINCADKAMYIAKKQGKNKFCYFTQSDFDLP